MRVRLLPVASLLAAAAVFVGAPALYAATDSENANLTQTVNAGTISTSILDNNGDPVVSPSFGMSATTAATTTRTSSGTYGSNTQRITVENPGAANNGWNLTLAASGSWTDGSNSYPFDAATSDAGQLSVDPSAATLFGTFGSIASGFTQGSAATFNNGTVDSITLLSAASGTDDVWSGYLTGIDLSQTVPAGTPAGSYTLTVTQTVTTL